MTPDEYIARETSTINEQNAKRAAFLISQPLAKSPDETAAAFRLANALNLPGPVVDVNYKSYAQKIMEKKYEAVLGSSPKLSSFMLSGENFRIAADDIENLSWWEKFGLQSNEAVKGIPGGAVSAGGLAMEGAGQLLTPVDPKVRLPLQKAIAKAREMSPDDVSALRKRIFQQGDINPQMAQSVLSDVLDGSMLPADAISALEPSFYPALKAASDALQAGGEKTQEFAATILPADKGMEDSLGRQVGSGLGSLLTILGVGLVTGGTGAAAFGGAMGAGEAASNARKAGADEDTQTIAALYGILPGMTDAIPIERLLSNPATKAGLASFLRAVGVQSITEGTQEAAQQMMQNAISRYLHSPDQAMFDGVSDSFASGGIIGAIVEAGRVAANAALPGRMHKNQRAAEKAVETVEKLGEISAQSAASKLRERAPGAFRQFVEQSTEETKMENVFVNGRHLAEYFQSMGQDPFEYFEMMDGVNREAVADAIDTGGDLKIPTSTYASSIAGSDHDAFFIENSKFDTEEFSAREAAEFNERADEARRDAFEEAERIREEASASASEDQIVYDEMVSRIRAAGRSVEEATKVATLYVAEARTAAADEGMTVGDYLRTYPLPNISGELPSGIAYKKIDDVDFFLAETRNRKAFRDSRVSLLEFISDYGGINDPGGELRARDAEVVKRGKGKKSLKLARGGVMAGVRDMFGGGGSGKKHGVDDVALAAIEAGYLADDPVANEYRAALAEGREIPDITRPLWDAIDRELRGDAQYAADPQAEAQADQEAQLDDIEAYLSSLGVSLNDDDATIRQALEGARQYAQGPDGARGLITFAENGSATISLFQSANLSTLLHETAHTWLFNLSRRADMGSEVAAARMASVKKWWRENAADVARDANKSMPGAGVTAADVEAVLDNGTAGDAAKDAAIDVGLNEQFARAGEAYLLEGKAPTAELRSAFTKFMSWLTRIYSSVRDLNVNINDDIRDVFDRIIATEEEISRARSDMGAGHPLFATAEEMGLTNEEYNKLIDMKARAEASDTSRLLKKTMEPIRRKAEEWFKDERERVKGEVIAKLERQSDFRAVQELRFAKDFGGEPVPAQKLDRAIIEKEYGAGYIPLLPGATSQGRGHRNAVFASEGGVHPDIVAGSYGYATGRDLLEALIRTPSINEAVEAETDRVMRELHGDVLNDGSIEAEAMEAIHNDDKAKLIAYELKAVTDVAGIDIVLTAKEAKRVAVETVDALPVKDAIAAHRYLAAERNAANEAQDIARQLGRESVWTRNARRRIAVKSRAAIRGEATMNSVASQIEAANASTEGYNELVGRLIDAKRRQLLNHALYMASKDAAEFVGKVEDKGARLNKSDKQLSKSRNVDYVKAARAIASKFGLARPESDFDMSAWLLQLRGDDPVSFSAIQDAIVTYTRDATEYRKMPLRDLSAVNDALDSILETGKRSRLLEIEGKSVDKQEAIDNLNAELDARGLKPNPAMDRELTKTEAGVRMIMGWASALRRVENWARAMDSGKQGAFTRYIVRPVMGALDAYRVDKADKLGKLLEIINARRDTLTGQAVSAPELNGYTFKNKASLIHAILHSGNKSNMSKLLLGRGWTTGFVNQQQATTPKGKLRFRRDGSPVMTKGDLDTSSWDAFIERVIREGIITSEDIKMVNAIWALNEEIKRPAQATHKKLFGFYFKEIEAEGYDTAAGRLTGGYVPAVLDRDASNDGVLRAGEDALDQQSAGFLLPTAGSGFTKGRVENYTKPLALDLTLLPAHVDKVLRFTHLDPAVRQVHGLVVDRRFGEKLAQFDPTLADNLLLPWLQRVAQQSVDAPSTSSAGRSFENILRTLRKRVGFNTMFANLVNAAQQVTGLSVAATVVKASHLKNATARYAKSVSASREEVFTMSPFMRERVKNATRETQMRIQDVVREPTTYGEFQMWVEKHGYFMQSAVQSWVDVPVWMAAYDQAVAGGMNEKDAIFEADATIRRSMGGMNPEDVSKFESGGAWKRLFTMFYTYFNGQANHLAERGSSIFREYGWGGSGKLFHLYLFGVMVPAVGAEMIMQAAKGGLGDEDEDGEYWDDLLGLFFGSQTKYATAMTPIAGQLMQVVFNQFNDQLYDDKLSLSPTVSSLDRGLKAPYSAYRALAGEGSAQVAVGDGLTAFALVTGIPVNWLAKPLGYAAGVAEGKFSPEGPVDILQGVVSGRDGTAK